MSNCPATYQFNDDPTRYQRNVDFLTRVSDPIQGWLFPLAAVRTLDLLDWQADVGIRGGLFEIGVFCGKYFSLLLHAANATRENALGIDLFEFAPVSQVLDLLGRNGADASRVQMIARPSKKVTSAEVVRLLGGKARFISIDGSHLKSDVLSDLRLSEKVLCEEGIIAADDVLNCQCLGVTEAVCEFLPGYKRRLVPFAYVPNKLLLCRPTMRDAYMKVLEDALLAAPHDQIGENFRHVRSLDRMKVITEFMGSQVLVAS